MAIATPGLQAMLDNISDGDLVSRYVKDRDQSAIRTLVDRYHDRLYSRFLSEIKNVADAKDLEQQLWLQVHRNLDGYKDEGKFAHFISRIATNLLNDFWRQKGRRSDVFVENRSTGSGSEDEYDEYDSDNYKDNSPDEEQKLITDELVQYLVTVLIPQLPVEQRTAWLLRHESEYWEPGRRLDWSHLANLNGIEEAEAWEQFELARKKMMKQITSKTDEKTENLSEEETLVFMVWSQAQRLRKEQQFTWDYFAELLGVPTNTMKTRYRTAQMQLSEGLKARMWEP